MFATWHRTFCLDSRKSSFAEAANGESFIAYVPLIGTELGVNSLARDCEQLRVYPAHTLDARYSLVSEESILWPDSQRRDGATVLRAASERAGIIGNCEFGWKGFADLGLAIAFEKSVPDATLPLFYWEAEGWRPLVKKG